MKNYYVALACLITISTHAQVSLLGKIDNSPVRQQQIIETITASISYQGYDETQAFFGQGEYEVFLDNTTGILDKPIIILDGFDPGDSRDINGLYNSLAFNGQNMADILRDEGFDIIVLNAPTYISDGLEIDGGGDYIQRNAMVLVALIDLLNTEKVGDEPLVVLGPSMGGLIARYGLSYMEQNSLNADTRLYISFDSPHKGANVPMSLQYLINYLAFQSDDPLAQQAVDQLLNSAAAKEMLVDHLNAHLLAGSDFEQDPALVLPAGAPDFRDPFQAELDALGFPQNVRNVAIVNGSGLGITIGTPGMQVVDTTLDLGNNLTGEVELHFMPLATETIEVTRFDTFFSGFPVQTFDAMGAATTATDGVDSAPGGISNISNALGDGTGNPVIEDFIMALQQDEFSFIPLLSSLAIENEDNWYAVPDLSNSPFVNSYIPDENEPHVSVSQASAQFALDEIRNGSLSTSSVASENTFKLLKNPVRDVITVGINPLVSVGPIKTQLFSTEGKLLHTQVFNTNDSQIFLQANIASGIYILRVTDTKATVSFKVIVE
ncbi:MAG: hypothetical protein ACI97R_000628 [Candidatus Azotimanducaceae bacterium]|jgi:hypothetical protein